MLGAARRGGGDSAPTVAHFVWLPAPPGRPCLAWGGPAAAAALSPQRSSALTPIGLRSGTQCHLVLKHTLKLVWPKSYRSCVRYRTDELKSQV